MPDYSLEFILTLYNVSTDTLRDSIIEFGKGLEIIPVSEDSPGEGRDFKIRIHTQDPAVVFDTCAQFGRLKSVKVQEGRSEGGA